MTTPRTVGAAVALAVAVLSSRALAVEHTAWVAGVTYAVIDGTVSTGTFSYDANGGPRYEVTFSSATTVLGPTVATPLTLKVSGGPIPDSNGWLELSTTPHFSIGQRYIVFLVNDTGWRWLSSPVLTDHAFPVHTVLGYTRVFSQDGAAIMGLTGDGLQMGSEVLDVTVNLHPDKAFTTPPAVVAGVQTSDVAGALTPAQFVSAFQSYLSASSLSVGAGTFHLNPDPTRHWRFHDISDVDDEREGSCPAGASVCEDVEMTMCAADDLMCQSE